jgi:hypothetical protein
MTTAIGLGALLGSAGVALATNKGWRLGPTQLWLGCALGLALIVFALTPSFLLAISALLVIGGAGTAFWTLNSTQLTASVEPHLYGRINSVALMGYAAVPLGAVPIAWSAETMGGSATLFGAGVGVLAVVLAMTVFYPHYRYIR